jgi:hypothetical protein
VTCRPGSFALLFAFLCVNGVAHGQSTTSYATDSSSTQTNGAAQTMEIISAKRFEVVLAIPAYVVDNPDSPKNGFGDWQFLCWKRGTRELHLA